VKNEIDRRNFLKLSAASLGTALASNLLPLTVVNADGGNADAGKAVLYDATLCLGMDCRLCELACKQWNKLPRDMTFTHIKTTGVEDNGASVQVISKHQCMHCLEPSCAEACLVGALHKTANGPVVYDENKCIGCRYCMVACPFGAPTFEWDKTVPWIRKCTFCADRLETGAAPSCVDICPNGALKFGERNELIAEARQRIDDNPEKYIDHIYGENENGGTSWLYLSPVSFERVGYPVLDSGAINARFAMNAVPPVAVAVAAAMTGVYWLTLRREKLKTPGEDRNAKEEVTK
jgi:formate dehydrogenase iron-sulfur subunit